MRVEGKLTKESDVQRGLDKGDALSKILFNLAFKNLVRQMPVNPWGTIFSRMLQCLAYADIVLISRGQQDLKESFVSLEGAATNVGPISKH